MRIGLRCFFLFFLLLCLNSLSIAAENIFYVLRYQTDDRMTSVENTVASLKKNYRKIDILIPQAYTINESGEVSKEIEPELYQFAVEHNIQLMPLVTNTHFDKEIAHRFLADSVAQTKAINSLVELCQKNHFYGLQLDFEMIKLEDRDALTQFYTLAANELHKNGFKVSFALAPVVTDKAESVFLKKVYENWQGAYDLKKLGEIADFISIMAYNQHAGGLTPGSTGSFPWVNAVLKYALQYIPANKISIGIGDYSTHWYTGATTINDREKIVVKMRAIDYQTALNLAHENNAKLIWDDQSKNYYVIFTKHWLNEFVFVEDVKSFTAKYTLVKQYKLRGISVFDLGTEDPNIWKIL